MSREKLDAQPPHPVQPPALEQSLKFKDPLQKEAPIIPRRARRKAISELRRGYADGTIEMAKKLNALDQLAADPEIQEAARVCFLEAIKKNNFYIAAQAAYELKLP